MRPSRDRTARTCFGVLFIVGVGFLGLGLLLVPLMPFFQLDAVLSPIELSDPKRCEETLALLKKASGNQWLFWTAGGLVVVVTSSIGFWALPGQESRLRYPHGG